MAMTTERIRQLVMQAHLIENRDWAADQFDEWLAEVRREAIKDAARAMDMAERGPGIRYSYPSWLHNFADGKEPKPIKPHPVSYDETWLDGKCLSWSIRMCDCQTPWRH